MSLRLGDPGQLTTFSPPRTHAAGSRPAPSSASRTAATTTPHGFSLWLAGGGVKGGFVYGATDDFGFQVADVTGKVIREILA